MSWLRRKEAAAYCRISLASFDRRVKDRSLPAPDRTLGVPRWRADWLDGGTPGTQTDDPLFDPFMAALHVHQGRAQVSQGGAVQG